MASNNHYPSRPNANIVHIAPSTTLPHPRLPPHHTRNLTENNQKLTSFRRSIRITNASKPAPIGALQTKLEPSINQNISEVSVERNSTQPNSEPWMIHGSITTGPHGNSKGRESKEQDGRGTKYVQAAG